MSKQENLTHYTHDYLSELRKDRSKSTCYTYHLTLSRLAEVVGFKKPEDIQPPDINNDFVDHIKQTYKLADMTIFQNLQIVRHFFEFLRQQGIKSIDPGNIADKEMYKSLRKHIFAYHGDYLTNIEKKEILDYWRESADKSNPRGIRNQIIIKLLATLGLSVSELTYLNKSNVNLTKRQLVIKYKNSSKLERNRTVSLDAETLVLLRKYFDMRTDKCDCLIVAFKVDDAFIVDAWPLTQRSIERIIHNTAYDLKIDKRVTPSTFRSTLIRELDDKGYGKMEINELLGLSDTSVRYTYMRDKNTD